MKRIFSFFLAMMMLLGLVACGETGRDEPEVSVKAQIIQNGASDYMIVHDGSAELVTFANEVRDAVAAAFGVTLPIVSAAGSSSGAKEIILGQSREIAKKTYEKMTGIYDFALEVEREQLVLCAKNEISYRYLAEYLKTEVFVKDNTGGLALDSNDNIIYSQSSLVKRNYVEYILAGGKDIVLTEHFEKAVYKNANTVLPYRLYVPFNYDSNKSYPLVVNLHGAGLRGSDNERHLLMIDSLFKKKDLPADEAIILVPQCPADNKWVDTIWEFGSYSLANAPESNELKAVVELVKELQSKYSVDEKRIYACGFSMGGYGTWNLLMNHPDLFCAGVAMCGAGDPTQTDILKDIPVWAVHGALDPTVPVQGSRDMVEAIKAAGGDKINYTELPTHEHDVWTYTYNSTEIFGWLFQQSMA